MTSTACDLTVVGFKGVELFAYLTEILDTLFEAGCPL